MSRAFLDSHVAYWLALDETRLAPQATAAIIEHRDVVVSSLMFAEFEMKALLRKVPDFSQLARVLGELRIAIEPFDYAATREIARFASLVRHDPFDRMIFAQAAARPGTTFYTADAALVGLGLDWVVDARA